MHYAPFLRDGRWWYGMVRGGRPTWKVGFCAGARAADPELGADIEACGGHEDREGAVQCAREWIISRCREAEFSAETGILGQEICLGPHRMKPLQSLLLRRCGRRPLGRDSMRRILWLLLRKLLPAVTTAGFSNPILRSKTFPLCLRHRSPQWLRATFPQDPAEVLDLI